VDDRAEPGLGHSDYRDAELGLRMRAQAGPAAEVEARLAVDDQQAQPVQTVQSRAPEPAPGHQDRVLAAATGP
jgi:hypothetical protein